MKKFISTLGIALLESPAWKTLFNAIIPVIVGILSGVLIAEITITGQIDWKLCYKARSSYALLVIILVSYFYYMAVYKHEKDIERFLDDDYCRAYMRSKCLPEAAERYKELIRNGQGGELEAAMREFEKILR